MTDQNDNLDELEQEVLAFIKRRESSRDSQEEQPLLSDELSDIAEVWNTFELLDKNGNLDIAFTKEGLHVSPEGYKVISKIIKKYL